VIYQDHGSTIDGGFFPFQALDVAAQFAFGSSFQLKYEPAVHVGIQNFRMHVAFAADVGVLPKFARYLFNRENRSCRRISAPGQPGQ
jgi:hypothetical protein